MPKVIKRGAVSELPSSQAPSSARPRKGAPRKRIRKDVVEAKQEARRIIEDAEQQANRIRDEAEQEREQLRQQGYDEGYQEGVGQYTEQTTKALLEIDQLKVALEPEYIKLVTVCVEKIVGEELKLHSDSIIGIVRNALKAATQQREINVMRDVRRWKIFRCRRRCIRKYDSIRTFVIHFCVIFKSCQDIPLILVTFRLHFSCHTEGPGAHVGPMRPCGPIWAPYDPI